MSEVDGGRKVGRRESGRGGREEGDTRRREMEGRR